MKVLGFEHFQFVHVHKYLPECKRATGVPQGCVLRPILFNIFMLPLGDIIRKRNINFHRYADDTQTYLSAKPDGEDHLVQLETCPNYIKTSQWVHCFIQMKTETQR